MQTTGRTLLLLKNPIVHILLFWFFGFGALYAILGPPPIAQFPSFFKQEILTLKSLAVWLFVFPAMVFLLSYWMFYERIAGHRPKFIRHDRDTGYHLNKPIVSRALEGVGYVIGSYVLLFCLSSFSDRGIQDPPPLWFSIVFFFGSLAYLGIRLNYRLQPARDERTANEQKKATDEARKAYEATLQPVTPPNVAPLLALATQGLINQKSVIIGTSQDFEPIYYREEPGQEERYRHTYVIGASGYGKTTCLQNLIAQDIRHGNGVIVLSSEQELFEKLLLYIPESRADDLIYFDPSDTIEPIIGFNPFTRENGENLHQKSGELMTTLERTMGKLGVSMKPMIRNAVQALLHRPHATFSDVVRLIDPHESTLRTAVKNDQTLDEETRTFWKEYDRSAYYKKSYEAVLNSLNPFLSPSIATVLSTSSISFKTDLNKDAYIIFLDLSGLRGTEATTIGRLLLAQIQQSSLIRDKASIPYYLYIDEFQKYAVESEESLIELFNGARKYKLGVTLAHQTTANIPTELIKTITTSSSTKIVLHLSADDAPFFTRQLQLASPTLLQNLGVGQAYVQTPSHNIGIPVSIPATPVVALPKSLPPYELKARSKANFGTTPDTSVPIPTNQPTPPPAQKKKSFGITFE